MPKEAFYFSHDSNSRSDEKILKLRLKYGWEGYGIYWALIEMLRDSSTYELECDLDLIAFELRCDKDKIKSIIFDFNLFIISGSNFFSHSLKRRMDLKEAKSEQARDAARTRWAKQKKSNSNADALQKQSNSNAIKEKQEKKENEIHTKSSQYHNDEIENDAISFNLDFTKDKFKTEQANKAWVDWLEYRYQEGEPVNRKRQPYVKKELVKLATINGQLNETVLIEIVKKCIAMGWKNLQLTDEMEAKLKKWQAA